MEQICLHAIHKNNKTIKYSFSFTDGLSRYFSGKPFLVEYPFDITHIPDSIACIPFVSCILPIIWLTDSILILSELDHDFFHCLHNIKNGYKTLFPESIFGGTLQINRIVKNTPTPSSQHGLLFSGGLDATQSLISHLREQPHLISIWGSDISYHNEAGWNATYSRIENTARQYNLPNSIIKSTFREFDLEHILSADFGEQLKDSWWHGVKHGIGLLGHVAPYAWEKHLSILYIASSNCPADGLVRCASNPLIDNYLRFCGCQIVHDGYEYSRQDKARNIIEFCRKTMNTVFIHACWQNRTGQNCCHCEKCYRTISALIVEGANPIDFGFYDTPKFIKDMQQFLLNKNPLSEHLAKHHWLHIQNRAIENQKHLDNSPFWADIKWLLNVDFNKIVDPHPPLSLRIRKKLATICFYQVLSKLKKHIKQKR